MPAASSVTHQGASSRRLVVLAAVLAVAVGGLVAVGPLARATVPSTQQAKLTAADGATDDQFGFSVAISGDTALVGVHFDDDAGPDSGSAHVFTRSGATWTQQAKLTAADAAGGEHFGSSVAISGDTAVVGADSDDDAGDRSGSAYVFALANGAPTSDPGGPYAVVEGSSILLNGSGSSDPDSDALTFDWSPGTFLDNPSSATPTSTGIDDGVEGLTLTVTDPGGLSDAAGTTVTVANVAPSVASITAPVDPAQVGTEITANGTFADPGVLDTHTAVWDWGDGSTSPGAVVEADGSGTAGGTHTYTAPGVYTVTLTVNRQGR